MAGRRHVSPHCAAGPEQLQWPMSPAPLVPRYRRDRGDRRVATTMADYHVSVREWPRSEQPREKLASLGESQLSTAELLAIMLRVGTHGEDVLTLSQRLLVKHHGLTGL